MNSARPRRGAISTAGKDLTDDHRALIASFKNSLGGVPYALIQIPTIILTLLVTIAAGGLGSVVAAGLTRGVSELLFGVGAADGPTYLAVGAVLTASVLLATYIPARRATRIDPTEALKSE